MVTLREAAQQALEAMEDAMYRADTHEFYDAKESLRAALAEPVQPVANRDTLDQLWQQALMESVKAGEQYTRYHFAALVEEHLKAEGYRHCAKGQRTTQWCGMLEQAVRIEREECAKVCDDYDYPSECAAAIRSRT